MGAARRHASELPHGHTDCGTAADRLDQRRAAGTTPYVSRIEATASQVTSR